MTLIEYILKNDSIDFKYLFKSLRKNLLTIVIITFTLFIISSIYSYKNMSQKINVKIYFEVENDFIILNETYRKAMSTNNQLKQFIKDFVIDFYKSYYVNLSENNLKNYKFVKSTHNEGAKYFLFTLDLSSWMVPTMEQLNSIKNEIVLSFYETLSKEANKYSSAQDIDYKTLNLSSTCTVKPVEVLATWGGVLMRRDHFISKEKDIKEKLLCKRDKQLGDYVLSKVLHSNSIPRFIVKNINEKVTEPVTLMESDVRSANEKWNSYGKSINPSPTTLSRSKPKPKHKPKHSYKINSVVRRDTPHSKSSFLKPANPS